MFSDEQQPSRKFRLLILRASDQAAVAVCIAVGLAAMASWWVVNGGHRGRLIEIDRAQPLPQHFAVDINQADWPELTQLPSIGETLAKRIVASRAADGQFVDHDDLLRVPGIGPRTLDDIRGHLLPIADAGNLAGDAPNGDDVF